MARKNDVLQDVPVDKLDSFLKSNYRKIIGGIVILIVAALCVYAAKNYSDSNRSAQLDSISLYELSGLNSLEQIDKYIALADEFGFAKDYIYYTAGCRYVAMGFYDLAVKILSKAGGDYAEFARGLLYDISDGKEEILSTDIASGAFSDIWYYRAILYSDSKEEKDRLMNDYADMWPRSLLLDRLIKWGF